MRKWGYGLAGLLVLGLFAGVANPDDPQINEQTVQFEPQVTEAPTSPTLTEEPEPQTSAPAEPEPENQGDAQQPIASGEPKPAEPSATATPTSSPTSTRPAAGVGGEVSDLASLLAQLVIEEEFPSGYDRDLFRHWIDADRDGCDARREVLILEAVIAPKVGDGCSLTGGSWYSAFDGVTTEDPSLFDIDHLVPLKEAWDSGAHAWDSDRRRAFANDLDLPQALIAVSRSSNRSKGADDPSDWLPPLVSYHCQYIEDWMVVKNEWELSVDAREFSALRTVASNC
jgi:hypothetical protein